MMNLPSFASAGYYVHTYRYLDPNTEHVSSEYELWGSMPATIRRDARDINDLGMKIDNWAGIVGWSKYRVNLFIEGALDDNSPWTLPSKTYRVKANWKISGEFDGLQNNFLKFEYKLYWLSGVTKNYVLTQIHTYTSDRTFNEENVGHFLGSVYLSSSKVYYIDISITLEHYNTWASCSDFWDGGNKINFENMDFYYYVDTGGYF